MTTPAFLLDASARNPAADMWFAEPAGFTTIPVHALLNAPGSSGAEALHSALAPVLDSIGDDLARQHFLVQLARGQQLLAAIAETGTHHCSIGLHRDDVSGDGNGHLLSLFTISWRDIATASPALTAARAVAGAEGHTHVEYVELPCGPASFSELVRTPDPASGLPPDPLLQVFAHLPHPDGKRLVVLTLGTTAVDRRAEYRSLVQQIAENVSFENPLPAPEANAEVPEGG
ncbi:hypothetical protein [Streptomyces sp. SYP-A7185]|uniref:hypothetical protein n=1 Tax=Streptomyces sp. SYP-A7185 TaxID=3040076 RepID=UPI0038F72EA5